MKIHIVTNGVTAIALTPETEIEKLQLISVFSNPAGIEVKTHDKLQILDKSVTDTVVLTAKSTRE